MSSGPHDASTSASASSSSSYSSSEHPPENDCDDAPWALASPPPSNAPPAHIDAAAATPTSEPMGATNVQPRRVCAFSACWMRKGPGRNEGLCKFFPHVFRGCSSCATQKRCTDGHSRRTQVQVQSTLVDATRTTGLADFPGFSIPRRLRLLAAAHARSSCGGALACGGALHRTCAHALHSARASPPA